MILIKDSKSSDAYFEKLINASDLIEWIMETDPDWCVGTVRSIVDHIEALPSATPTLYGYPIEHLEMIARVMAKENCKPEAVAQMLQNAGEIAKIVRDEMMKMLKESVERSFKGEE